MKDKKFKQKNEKRGKQTFHKRRNVTVKYTARFSVSLVIWKVHIKP